MQRRHLIATAPLLGLLTRARAAAADPFDGDPHKSHLWPPLRTDTIGAKARWRFDDRVQVQGPGFAEDPMNVPVSVRAELDGVQRIVVVVDRNPIKKVLELQPVAALPVVSFRFKLEQGSPVRALVLVGGVWHVGGAWVDSAGGGCTVSGATRKDGSWTQTRLLLNAWLGAGHALAHMAQKPGGLELLRQMAERWPFFDDLLAKLEMVCAKADLEIAELYLSELGDYRKLFADLRTEFETGNTAAVLDGEIDGFIESGIRWRRSEAA